MISKGKAVLLVFVFMLITAVGTTFALQFFSIEVNGKIVVDKEEYEYYGEIKAAYGDLFELKDFLLTNYYLPVDEEDLDLGMKKGLFEGVGDSYTQYFTKEEYELMMSNNTGEFYGVGISVLAMSDGSILIVSTFEDSPAEKVGLKAGDNIVKVNGIEYNASTAEEAIRNIRGEEGTDVKITVQREEELIDFNITRAKIEVASVELTMLEDDIAYITISTFNNNTGKDFEKIVNGIESQAKGIIVDIRNNVGGIVDSAIEVCDVLLDEAELIYIEGRQDGFTREYSSKDGKTDLPFVILVNENTASSSEILAIAIKENVDAPLIGTKTHGKGILQLLMQLDNGDGIEYTVAQYFSKSGNPIHEVGVEPDIVVEIDEENLDAEGYIIDTQLEKAIEVLKEEME